MEKKYLSLDVPKYNILMQAEASDCFKHRAETIEYLSSIRRDKNNPMYGKTKSPEFLFVGEADKLCLL